MVPTSVISGQGPSDITPVAIIGSEVCTRDVRSAPGDGMAGRGAGPGVSPWVSIHSLRGPGRRGAEGAEIRLQGYESASTETGW